MAVTIPVCEIKGFFNENKPYLMDKYHLVAEESDECVGVYITEEKGFPCFVVEVDGAIVCKSKVNSESEIERVYAQILNLYICGYENSFELHTVGGYKIVEYPYFEEV